MTAIVLGAQCAEAILPSEATTCVCDAANGIFKVNTPSFLTENYGRSWRHGGTEISEIIAAIDLETTGLAPHYHDIIEIVIQPLDNACETESGITAASL
ncbi:MAG: hypothetical protein IJT83_12690 [Victivallales bacterium]|nr:hypothetical protein [Victivallales bacterium]